MSFSAFPDCKGLNQVWEGKASSAASLVCDCMLSAQGLLGSARVRQAQVGSGQGWASGSGVLKGIGEHFAKHCHQWLPGVAFIVTGSWRCDKLYSLSLVFKKCFHGEDAFYYYFLIQCQDRFPQSLFYPIYRSTQEDFNGLIYLFCPCCLQPP